MAQLTLFPLQYLRQEAAPIDADMTFSTTAERVAYLQNARRYPGQIVSDIEQDLIYFLDKTRSIWIPIGGGTFSLKYNSEKTYNKEDAVILEKEPGVFSLYIAKENGLLNVPPTDATKWYELRTGGTGPFELTPEMLAEVDLPIIDTAEELAASDLPVKGWYKTSNGHIMYKTEQPQNVAFTYTFPFPLDGTLL